MLVLKRPPGDTFTLRQFVALTSQIKIPKDVFYIWSMCIDPTYIKVSHLIGDYAFHENEIFYRNVIESSIKTDLIIIGVKDHLTGSGFNPIAPKYTDMMIWLKQMSQHYSDKKIILFTSLENLEIDEPNVDIIPWGGDITNHQSGYQKLEPVLEKNLNSKFTFLSLNRNKRTHRAMLVSLLYGLDIQNSGLISCMFKDSMHDLFEYTNWKVKDQSVYLKGVNILNISELPINDAYDEVYKNQDNDNVSNFKDKLIPYYQDTFVEIVAETSFTETCYNLTEKTLNSIYGCSFPILLCSPGTVAFLRNMGLDMFDDIIDHGYDIIEDPAERLEYAILKNKELLVNNKKTKNLWIQNKDRFKKNVEFCRDKMYQYYNTRSSEMFNDALSSNFDKW